MTHPSLDKISFMVRREKEIIARPFHTCSRLQTSAKSRLKIWWVIATGLAWASRRISCKLFSGFNRRQNTIIQRLCGILLYRMRKVKELNQIFAKHSLITKRLLNLEIYRHNAI